MARASSPAVPVGLVQRELLAAVDARMLERARGRPAAGRCRRSARAAACAAAASLLAVPGPPTRSPPRASARPTRGTLPIRWMPQPGLQTTW